MKLTARAIGKLLKISAAEVNRLLVKKKYLSGIPGNYNITEEGKKFGEEKDWWNGFGGYAMRGYSYVEWDEEVLDELKDE